jgi:hypothetical protein
MDDRLVVLRERSTVREWGGSMGIPMVGPLGKKLVEV